MRYYKPEIDGLRALAVVPVILFHAGFPGFAGGYLGVDVFFVISGYLITSISRREDRDGRFSVVSFYARRARRILPVLMVVLAATACVGWLLLVPESLKSLAQQTVATVLFANNMLLAAKGTDYFGPTEEENPLLHTWSLGVEEQYYLVFPVVWILTAKRSDHFRIALFLVIAAVSFAGAMFFAPLDQTKTFYWLPFRAWEIAAGAVLALAEGAGLTESLRGERREVVGAAGLLALLAGFMLATSWPLPAQVLVVLGSVALISVAGGATTPGRLLASGAPVLVGQMSYSLYLWHQPVLAYLRVWLDRPLSIPYALPAVILTFALAWASWKAVEIPFRAPVERSRRLAARWRLPILMVGSTCLLLVFGVLGHFNNGHPGRDPLFMALQSNPGLGLQCNGNFQDTPACRTGARPQVVLWGDSYAMHLLDGLRRSLGETPILQLTLDDCPPILGLDHGQRAGKIACADFNAAAFATIAEMADVRTVVLSSPFYVLASEEAITKFKATLDQVQQAGKRVVIVGPPPANGVDFGRCMVRAWRAGQDLSSCDFRLSDEVASQRRVRLLLKRIATEAGVTFVDLMDFLCEAGRCRVSAGNEPIYRDEGHLSRFGSVLIVGGEAFRSALRAPDAR